MILLLSTGDPGSHQEAKEILAGFTGAFIDREVRLFLL